MFAQEKTQAYYSTHENEIFQDAQSSFNKGDYERAAELCKWHYIIVGNNDANSLRERAERCVEISKDITALNVEGKVDEALEAARNLLSINPSDPDAKRILDEFNKLEEPLPVEEELPVADTLVTEPVQIVEPELVQEPVSSVLVNSVPRYKGDNPSARIILKAGVSILDLKQFSQSIAPVVGVGLYDLAGSRFGTEVGLYFCPGLSDGFASLFGIDADLVFRAGEGLYAKAGVGFYSCSSKNGDGAVTKGICAGLGLTYFWGGHLCLGAGVKFFHPSAILSGTEKVTTFGAIYEFPYSRTVVNAGIAPIVSIGWAF